MSEIQYARVAMPSTRISVAGVTARPQPQPLPTKEYPGLRVLYFGYGTTVEFILSFYGIAEYDKDGQPISFDTPDEEEQLMLRVALASFTEDDDVRRIYRVTTASWRSDHNMPGAPWCANRVAIGHGNTSRKAADELINHIDRLGLPFVIRRVNSRSEITGPTDTASWSDARSIQA